MALAQLITQVPGTLIKSGDWNNEFQNILTHPIALISPSTGAINFNNQAHTNFKLENIAGVPVAGTTGRILFNTTGPYPIVDNGTLIYQIPAVISTNVAVGQVPTFTATGGWVAQTPAASAGTALGSVVRGLQMNSTTAGQLSSWAIGQYAYTRTQLSSQSFFFQSTAGFTVDAGSAQVGTTSGGRDQGSTFTSTGNWVHFYLITTGANSTSPVGICSLAFPTSGPAMPSSYSAFTYLHTLFYTTASQFQSVVGRGAKMYYYQAGTTAQQSVTSSATQTAGTAFSIPFSTAVPPLSVCPEFTLTFHVDAVAAGEPYFIYLQSSNDAAYHRSIPNATSDPDLIIPIPNQASGSVKGAITTTARTVIAYIKSYSASNGDN